jgi:hypothetical protein
MKSVGWDIQPKFDILQQAVLFGSIADSSLFYKRRDLSTSARTILLNLVQFLRKLRRSAYALCFCRKYDVYLLVCEQTAPCLYFELR